MKTFFYICLLFMIVSCAGKKEEKILGNAADTSAKSSRKKDTVKNISTVTPNDTVIIAKFLKDSIATTISGLLREAPEHVVIYIDIKQGKNLTAILQTKDPKANIRINQLFTPDGKADGPFGKAVTRPIIKRGTYKLIVGHDLMAEGGSAVKFELRLIVK